MYEYISSLINDTWKDNLSKISADTKGLSHSRLLIKDVFHIGNIELLKQYDAAHKQCSRRFRIPRWLIEHPIQTKQSHSQSGTRLKIGSNHRETIYIDEELTELLD